jgi:hypothetical protein
LLRIPGSINSKNNAQVRIISFDPKISRPNINLLIGSFCAYLTDQEIKESKYRHVVKRSSSTPSFHNNSINKNEESIYWI